MSDTEQKRGAARTLAADGHTDDTLISDDGDGELIADVSTKQQENENGDDRQ